MEQEILNYSYAAVLALIGWLGKTLWDAVGKLKEDLKSIEIDLPKTYVSKVDIDSRLDKNVADLDRKIGSARFNLDQLSVGRDAFMGMLKSELSNDTGCDV